MKKLYAILIVVACFCLNAMSQTTNGTLTGNETWTTSMNPIHITGDVTVPDDITLTINAGVIVRFDAGKSLFIDGTGIIHANGTNGNEIVFTEYSAGSGWGHIVFFSSSTSNLTYCNISKGEGGAELVGGGLYISSSALTIDHCKIFDCSADVGGGIEIENSSPTVKNSFIYNNVGSGIDIYTGGTGLVSSPTIENNVIYGNGGVDAAGIYIYRYRGTSAPVITNNTIVDNNNDSESGYGGINRVGTANAVIKNCILWNNTQGANASQDCSTTGITISYCATTQGLSGTGMITLSSVNTDVTGPNFANPSVNDYNLTSLSPCTEAGTTGGPSTDILGNTRVGIPDIGAYENLDFLWQGDDGSNPTNWGTGANWNKGVIPTASAVVIIPDVTNDPVVNENPSTPAICTTLTINSGGVLTVAAGKALTVTGTLNNNGTLNLNSSSAGTATLIQNSYSKVVGASEQIQLYLTGGGNEDDDNFSWHYISPPVSSVATSVFTVNTMDLAQFVESRVTLGQLKQGWVAFDGYEYSNGGDQGPVFSELTTGKGYNYWDGSTQTYNMSGTLNTSNAIMGLSYSSNDGSGFNLLGNPFTAGLNWNDIINDVYFSFPANTSESLYFTRDNESCSYINGVGVPGDVNGYIPPMQGFFVKTYSSGNTITLPKAARTHTAHARYKGTSDIPLVRLKLVRNKYSTDETVVRFDNQAKSDFDLEYDAYKMSSSAKKILLYSEVGSTRYSINGQPFPDSFVEIPLTMNITKDTIHTISAIGLQLLENYNVTLKDLSNNFTADLRTTPDYTFSASPGLISGRFVLNISLKTTGFENIVQTKNIFNIYSANGNINIQTLVDEWDGKQGSVRIMDLTGKIVKTTDNAEFTRNSLVQLPFENRTGIYLVEIRSGLMRYTGKMVVR